jgi:hypothetical protein
VSRATPPDSDEPDYTARPDGGPPSARPPVRPDEGGPIDPCFVGIDRAIQVTHAFFDPVDDGDLGVRIAEREERPQALSRPLVEPLLAKEQDASGATRRGSDWPG